MRLRPIALSLFVFFSVGRAVAATFVVTNTADSGDGSLRDAIVAANATPGPHMINFNIGGGGLQTITPASPLPTITTSVVIDGTSQPGYAGVPLIELDGEEAPASTDGLQIGSQDTTIRGLIINRFSGDGIRISAAGTGNRIEVCWIGLNATGTAAQGNGRNGIYLTNVTDAAIGGGGARNVISGNAQSGIKLEGTNTVSNTIAGSIIGLDPVGDVAIPNALHGVHIVKAGTNYIGANVIAGNLQNGVRIEGSTARNNILTGSLIGCDATGTAARPNGMAGVFVSGSHNSIGSASLEPSALNVISGNNQWGIEFSGQNASNNAVVHNLIGTDISGLLPLGNRFAGVSIDSGGTRNVIGGIAPGSENVIAFNTVDGVLVKSGTNNTVRANRLHSNGGMGIDLGGPGVTPNDAGDADSGVNGLQNFPVLTKAVADVGSTRFTGSLNSRKNGTYQLDFYGNGACDATGNGEGEKHLGSTEVVTDSAGNAAFDVILPTQLVGAWVSATATDGFGNTSEFSACIRAESNLPPATFTVTNTNDLGPGSLRQALLDADGAPGSGPHTIAFNIPGDGPHTLVSKTGWPTLTNAAVKIDGYTQPGSSPNTLPAGDNAVIKIVLSGSTPGGQAQVFGLRFRHGGNVIRGLSIVKFLETALSFGSDSNVVEGCFVGITPDNQRGRNGRSGVSLRFEPANIGLTGSSNRIGGDSPEARNVIAGNVFAGVLIPEGSSNNVVAGNFIGTDLSGMAAIESGTGVRIERNFDNRIGGNLPGERNVISGNLGPGILHAGGGRATVLGNLVGLGADGVTPLGNRDEGLRLDTVSEDVVGDGTIAGANTIAFNGHSGVQLYSTVAKPGARNAVRANSIFGNAALGIDLGGSGAVDFNDVGDADTGDNNGQNYPVLTAATEKTAGTIISGTFDGAANTTLAVDFFASRDCDPSKHGEGQQFLGSTQVSTDASGHAGFAVTLPTVAEGLFITATATDPDGNTSEFSECVQADSELPGETFVVTHTGNGGEGSLRAAIIAVGTAIGGNNRIIFNIPGPGPHVIRPATSLGSIFRPVTIDGYSQPGAKANTLAIGNDAVIQIHLDAEVTGTETLQLFAPKIEVRGLAITGFNFGLAIHGSRNVVAGCFIGLDPSGAPRQNLSGGIVIFQGFGGGNYDEAIIGGESPADRNVISANDGSGIAAQFSAGHLVAGNYIGTDPSGMISIPNRLAGVAFLEISNSVIGGTSPSAGNLISGNANVGISVSGGAGNHIEGNRIGVTVDELAALGNKVGGVNIYNSTGNQVGSAGAANVIAGNSDNGVRIWGASGSANVVRGNFIGSGVGGTIPLGNGGPAIQVSEATGTSIGGRDAADWNTIRFNAAGVVVEGPVPVFIGGNIFAPANLPDLSPLGPGGSPSVPGTPSVTVSTGPTGPQIQVDGSNVGGPMATLMILTLDAAGVFRPSHFEDVPVDAAGMFDLTVPVTWPGGTGTFAAIATGTNGSSEAGLSGAVECRITAITLENGQVVIRWSGSAHLLHSMDLGGPWLPVVQQDGSATISPTEDFGFYRLACP